MSSSSKSKKDDPKADKKKAEAHKKRVKEYTSAADPSTVDELVTEGELEKKWFEGDWGPAWADVQFDGDACLKNVLKHKKDGFYVPAGAMVPLGAQMPEMTVLKYGGYFPQGTSFPGGVMIPMHARMVNLLPQETKNAAETFDESLCSIQ